MADEQPDHDEIAEEDATEETTAPAVDDLEEDEAAGADDGPPAESDGSSAPEGGAADPVARPALRIEAPVVGTVTLHYPSRDVQVVLDGVTAMRLLTMFHRRREGGLADVMSTDAPAFNGWFVLDLDEPLAMTWTPHFGTRRRTAVDPAPLVAA